MKKHLSLSERFDIENGLSTRKSFKEIKRITGADIAEKLTIRTANTVKKLLEIM